MNKSKLATNVCNNAALPVSFACEKRKRGSAVRKNVISPARVDWWRFDSPFSASSKDGRAQCYVICSTIQDTFYTLLTLVTIVA